MNWKEGFRRGRSHLLMAAILAIAGSIVVRMEDDALRQETGKAPPQSITDKLPASVK